MATVQKAKLARLAPIVLAGSINGIIEVFYSLTLGGLVFAGPLNDDLAVGLGLGLFSTIAVTTVTALTSSLPGLLSGVQNVPAILLSLVLATILTQTTDTETLPTAIAAIATTTLSVGLVSLLLGSLRLGQSIRYVPFPIIGGFLAGTGWFIVAGSFLLMTGLPNLADPRALFTPLALVQWLPGLAFAAIHHLLLPRYNHPLLLPGLILSSLPLFFLGLGGTGTTLGQAANWGLLLGPFTNRGQWQIFQMATLTHARWDLVLGQWQSLVVLLAVTLLVIFLNLSSLEVVLNREMNLNQELRVAGLANLVSGLGGGIVGFHSLGGSALGFGAIQAHSRWTGLIVAGVAAITLGFGVNLAGFFPRFILGGLGLSLGFSFLKDWLWSAHRRLPQSDYAIVVAIALTMAIAGVLPGVGVGVAIAIATFLINYSRIGVVRHQLSGTTHHSSVARAPHQQQALQAMGDQIQIFQLQGYLFFGTAQPLLDQIQQQMEQFPDPDLPQFLVIDFQQVTGMDSSVAQSFIKLRQRARSPLRMVLTHLRPAFQARLQRQGCLAIDDPLYHLEPSLDQGLAWCEAKLLETRSWRRRRYVPLSLQLQKLLADPDQIPTLMTYLAQRSVAAGDQLFDQGQTADCLYLLESGQVSTFRPQPREDADLPPARTYQAGTVLGLSAFFTRSAYPGMAMVDQPSVLYVLSRDRWQAMINETPKTAALFQEMLLGQLSDQLLRTRDNLTSLLS